MDEEDGRRRLNAASYEKVALADDAGTSNDDDNRDGGCRRASKPPFKPDQGFNDDGEDDVEEEEDDDDDGVRTGIIRDGTSISCSSSIWHRTLIPDRNITVTLWNGDEWPLFDDGSGGGGSSTQSQFAVKLIKFVLLTFIMISLVHVAVRAVDLDRDRALTLWHIWVFEADLIVRDCIVFFVVGRMWKFPGVDNLAFVGAAIVANIYYESQNFMWFLQHSLTLYEMHCKWPWELWVFVAILIPSIGALVVAHLIRAYQTRILAMKLIEMALCVFFFMLPMMPSKYFHLHHWYGGWLLGMHCNMDTWWSRFAMAYCWGMYLNGIAVYGRDPVLTCEYSYFLTLDQRCPYISCYLEALHHPKNDTDHPPVQEMVAADWRNCSSTDYIP